MIELNKVTLEDVLKLWEIQKQAFQEDFLINQDFSPAIETLNKFIEKINSCNFYCIKYKGMIVGGVCIRKYKQKEIWKISRIFIEPSFQSKGIGSYVIQKIQTIYSNVNIWILETPVNNIKSHKFYEKNGFNKNNISTITNTLKTINYQKINI